ncbi:MAG: hypothetical protein PHC83_01775 [Bacteroidales bacterium]|nr:hypothetical protein [Bacteroidales bacterium]MDD4208993.1 hypothetical protein [Bacteroidales bacterium]
MKEYIVNNFKAINSQYAMGQLSTCIDLEGCSLKTMMFEKYPSISPYTYCANNPMKYVDPTGMDYIVKITGLLANEATDQLKQSAPNLNITRNEETGELKASGKAQTQYEQQVLDAINNPNIEVNITAENSKYNS